MSTNKHSTVDESIANTPDAARERMAQIRKRLRAAVPNAEEGIRYGIPAFSLGRMYVAYAGYKNHIGFYPTPDAITHFADQLSEYPTAKGSIQFPHDKPLPLDLIEEIAQWRLQTD